MDGDHEFIWNRWWWVWQLPMGNSGQGSGRDQEIVATLPICKILWSALPGKFSLVQNHLYASTHLIVSPTLGKRKMITLSYQPSEKPSVFVHILSSPCTMLMIMMTVWNVFSKPMTRIMFSNIGIIITLLLQIEMWIWLKGRTVKLNLFATHKSCFSVWAPSISTRPPLQKKQPCKYAGDKYKHADEDKSQITSLCRKQSNNQKYRKYKLPLNAIKRKKSKFCESRSILNSLRIQIGPIIAFQNQSIASKLDSQCWCFVFQWFTAWKVGKSGIPAEYLPTSPFGGKRKCSQTPNGAEQPQAA